MRSRPVVALLVLTLPVWLVPALCWVGWVEGGSEIVTTLPQAFRYIFTGKHR